MRERSAFILRQAQDEAGGYLLPDLSDALDLRLKHKQFRAMPPLLSLSAIAKTFDNGTNAIERLDMDVADGEFVSLVGPSGCGKSTALRIIAGLLSPDQGHVRFATQKPEIGFVFQEPTLMPWA